MKTLGMHWRFASRPLLAALGLTTALGVAPLATAARAADPMPEPEIPTEMPGTKKKKTPEPEPDIPTEMPGMKKKKPAKPEDDKTDGEQPDGADGDEPAGGSPADGPGGGDDPLEGDGPARPDKQPPRPGDKKPAKGKPGADKPAKKPAKKLDPALVAKREKAQALVRRGQELASMGRREEAIEAFGEAVEIYPAYPLAFHELGVTFADQGNLPQAQVNLEKAVALAPDFTRARQALAEVLRRQKRWAEALDHYQKVVQASPKDLPSWYGIASILRTQKKDGEALYALQQLVAASDNPAAPAVVEAQREIDKLEKAGVVAKVWGPAAPTKGEDEPMTATAPGALPRHAGDTAFSQKRYLDALEQYEKAWDDEAPDAVLAYKIGATYAVMNDSRQALAWWRRSLAADPSRELVARHLAILVAKLRTEGKPTGDAAGDEDAVARAKEAMRNGDPGTALYLVQGLDAPSAPVVEAEARLRLGDFARARAMFEEILGEDPDNRVAKGGLAEALLRMGQGGAAEKAIQAWVGVEGSEGNYKARPETFLVFRRGEVEARLLAPPEPEE